MSGCTFLVIYGVGIFTTLFVIYVQCEDNWKWWKQTVNKHLFKGEDLGLSGYVYHGAIFGTAFLWPIIASIIIYYWIKNMIKTIKTDIDKVKKK